MIVNKWWIYLNCIHELEYNLKYNEKTLEHVDTWVQRMKTYV